MSQYDSEKIIRIVQQKKLNNIPSKGRNQWVFIQGFDGQAINTFIDAAKAEVNPGLYQEGEWWNREVQWNLERGNITLE
jgi:hypothetical protein